MTNDPDKPADGAENGPDGSPGEAKQRFDPFTNESDMFKIVLWVAGVVVVVVVLVAIARLIF